MSAKSILAAFNGSDSSVSALKYAAAMARNSNGHVTAVMAHAAREDYSRESRWITPDSVQALANANEAILQKIEDGFDQFKAELELGDSIKFHRLNGRVDEVIAKFARTHDVVVLGRYGRRHADGNVAVHPDRVAMISGRPVLVVPPKFGSEVSHKRVVLAWDGGRAAARALSDTMQILEGNVEISILTVGETTGQRPIVELIAHLDRHGIKATKTHLPVEGTVGKTILQHCREASPDLLVMGAYEHSKFRAQLLGGVTHDVVNGSPIPVLLSH